MSGAELELPGLAGHPAYLEPRAGPVEQAVARIREASGQEPVVIVVNQTPAEQIAVPVYQPSVTEPQHRDLTGLIFVLFLGVIFVAIIAMFVVACHETPQVHITRDLPNCHFLC